MPDTRIGTKFNEDGICQACLNYDKRKYVDWNKRWQELKDICKWAKSETKSKYDCAIAVSGGKDSFYIVYLIKELLGLNPVLVTVNDPFTHTKAGEHNFRAIGESFNCDHFFFIASRNKQIEMTKKDFEEKGHPLKYVEEELYKEPLRIAKSIGVPIIFYGENADYEYGITTEDSPFFKHNISDLKVAFMSYYVPWSSVINHEIARKYGFRDLRGEWDREGTIENFEQIDSLGYMVHLWMKYPKFGFQRVSDVVGRRIREGMISIDEGKKLISKKDYIIDQLALEDFCSVLGYTVKEFWDIVEPFWNKEIFEKANGIWKKKAKYEV